MTCPNADELLRFVLGELRVLDAEALAPHIAGCALCSATVRSERQLLVDLAVAPPRSTPDDTFAEQVLSRIAAPRRAASTRNWPAFSTPAVFSLVALAAAAALAFVPLHSATVQPSESSTGTVGARGAGSAHPRAFAEAFAVRGGVFAPVAGATLHSGDALGVRCTNTRDRAMRLLVFAIDAAERVHWIYPAYVDGSTDPESILLSPRTLDHMLDEVVEPEHVAPGLFRVFSVVSEAPLNVSTIERERHLLYTGAYTGARPPFLAGSEVEAWTATWSDE